MDTREKIVPLQRVAACLETGQWLAVVGLFDPLTALQASRLADLHAQGGRKILVLILDTGNTLLTAAARAALIAALRHVHLVAIAPPELWRSAIPHNSDVEIVDDPEGECARSAEFVQFILHRQQDAAN